MRTKKLWRIGDVNKMLLKLYVRFQELTARAEGQDMVEYALVGGMICFGATACSHFLAIGLSNAFANLSSTVGSYTS